MSSPPSNAAAAAAASAPKNRIGEYIAEKKIGSGSFATVWFGTDSRNGRPVAIKSISLERARTDAKQLANIKAEIAIMADLNHPNIVRLLDHKGSANHLYLILEYSDSGDLSQAIRRHGAFPEAIARDYFRQVGTNLA
jgi:serine/threonine protein kinase